MPSLEFTKLPLIEVVLRAGLTAPIEFGTVKITEMAASLVERFPDLHDLETLETIADIPLRPHSSVSQPNGFGVSNHGRAVTLSIQQQFISARWRRALGINYPPYPRYAALLDDLLWGMERVGGVGGVTLTASVVNMTYLNFVDVAMPVWNLLKGVDISLKPSGANYSDFNVGWQEPGGCDIRIRVQQAKIQSLESIMEGWAIETVAGRRFDTTTSAMDAYDQAHTRLIELFEGLTSDLAKEEWGYLGAT